MARWKNFSIWHGRFPHWRADAVLYYVAIKHKRELDDEERQVLFREFLKPNDRKWTVRALVVTGEKSEALVSVHEAPHGAPYELGDIVRRAVQRSAKAIMARSGERWPPMYEEPFDRIMRDDEETSKFLDEMLANVPCEGLDPVTGYQFCFVTTDDPE
ncbi:MAG: hypothetical protein AB7F50_00235 [Fimbriimonadaceae bacterium]